MSKRLKIRDEAKKLNPIDDLMFRTMAEDKEFCQEILRVILQDEKLIVLESTAQYAGTNPQGRSVILDAKFENVPDVCVVFISKFDIFNGNRSLYHVDRIIRETGENVGIKKQRRVNSKCVRLWKDLQKKNAKKEKLLLINLTLFLLIWVDLMMSNAPPKIKSIRCSL